MEEQAVTTFGKALRAERKRMDLTQAQLAEKIDTSQQNIAGWEAGRALPRQELFDKLVEFFGKDSPIAALPPRGAIHVTTTHWDRLASFAKRAVQGEPMRSTTVYVDDVTLDDMPMFSRRQVDPVPMSSLAARRERERQEFLAHLPEELRPSTDRTFEHNGRRYTADYWSPKLGLEYKVTIPSNVLNVARAAMMQLLTYRAAATEAGALVPEHLAVAIIVQGGSLSGEAMTRIVEEGRLVKVGVYLCGSIDAVIQTIQGYENPSAAEDEDWGTF